jgi:tetratricopeptide (TPR) repeat protein
LFDPDAHDGATSLKALVDWFRRDYRAHFLLIDSRTGFSEMGGLSSLELGDILVLVTGLNENNLDGLETAVGLFDANRGKDFRSRILPVMTVMSGGETEWGFKAQARVAELLSGCRDRVTIPSWTGAAYRAGSVLEEEWKPLELTKAYEKLADRLVELAKELHKGERAEASAEPSREEKRIGIARRLVDMRPQDPMSYYGLARLLWAKDKHDEALGLMKKARELAPQDWRILRVLGDWHLELDQVELAEQAYREVESLLAGQELTYEVSEALVSRVGTAFDYAQKKKSEEQLYREVLELADRTLKRIFPDGKAPSRDANRSVWGMWQGLARVRARCLDWLRDVEGAEKAFLEVRDASADSDETLKDLVTFYSRHDRYDKLIEYLTGAVSRGLDIATYVPATATALRKGRGSEAALDFLEPFRRAGGGLGSVANLSAGMVFDAMKQWDAAKDAYLTAVRLDPQNRDAWSRLAETLQVKDDLDEALWAANVLVEKFDDPRGYNERAVVLGELGRESEAAKDVRVALDRNVVTIKLLKTGVKIADETKDLDLEETCFERLLKEDLDPEDAAVFRAKYAYFLIQDRGDVSSAQKYLDEARQTHPEHGGVLGAGALFQMASHAREVGADPAETDLSDLVKLFRQEGDPLSVSERYWLALRSVFESSNRDDTTRWTAGACLVQGYIEKDRFNEAADLLNHLEQMGTPEGMGPVLHNLRLSFYGLSEPRSEKLPESSCTVEENHRQV